MVSKLMRSWPVVFEYCCTWICV